MGRRGVQLGQQVAVSFHPGEDVIPIEGPVGERRDGVGRGPRSQSTEGQPMRAAMAAMSASNLVKQVIVVDDDIDIRDPADVEYALATRMEASKDIFMLPAARGHEYVRVSDRGMRTKLGIDATVPFAEKARFARCEFKPVEADAKAMTTDAEVARKRLGL